MKRTIIAVICLATSACASTKQYFPVADPAHLATGNALISVARKNEIIGAGRSIEISDDGKVVGQVSPGKALIWERPAGDFQLQIVPAALAASHPTPLKVSAQAGQRYDFEVSWGVGTIELHPKER